MSHRVDRRRVALAWITVVVLLYGLLALSGSLPALASHPGNTNSTSYWEQEFPNAVQCYSHTGNSVHGVLVDDGKAVQLNPFNPAWPGDRWEALIVKAGPSGNDAVYPLPQAGVAYYPLENPGGQQPTVSHWIVCKGETPTTTTTSSTTTTTSSTTTTTSSTTSTTQPTTTTTQPTTTTSTTLPPVVGAAVTVSVSGTCQVDDFAGEGVISVTVSTAGGATVVITDSDDVVVETLSQDGVVTVPENAVYNWSATANDGFGFPPDFETSGSITIEECTPTEVGASILVTVGGSCVLDGDDGEGIISVNISVADGATVTVRDSDGDIVGLFSQDGSVTVPEGAIYNWSAAANDGFEFPSGFVATGSVTISTCSTPDVLPFTGVEPDPLVAVAIALLGVGLVVVTGGSYIFGWSDET